MAAREYRSAVRSQAARATRARVLAAARTCFLAAGWAGTTMRGVAAAAGVSTATVEQAFGTKAGLLAAAADVAIAGDDEPVPMLERPWARAAAASTTVEDLLDVVTAVLAQSQERSAGLVVAIFDGAGGDDGLATLARERARQRELTAGWIVDRLAALAPLRTGREDTVDTVWALMEPALYVRLTGARGWSTQRYRTWVAQAVRALTLDPGRDAP